MMLTPFTNAVREVDEETKFSDSDGLPGRMMLSSKEYASIVLKAAANTPGLSELFEKHFLIWVSCNCGKIFTPPMGESTPDGWLLKVYSDHLAEVTREFLLQGINS